MTATDRPYRILMVEGHAETVRLLTRLLTRLGHEVESAASIADALDLLERRPFDVFTSCSEHPDGNWCQLMRAVAERWPHVKGITISGHGYEEFVRESLEAGYSACLPKPVNIDEFLATLGRLLTPAPVTDKNTPPAPPPERTDATLG